MPAACFMVFKCFSHAVVKLEHTVLIGCTEPQYIHESAICNEVVAAAPGLIPHSSVKIKRDYSLRSYSRFARDEVPETPIGKSLLCLITDFPDRSCGIVWIPKDDQVVDSILVRPEADHFIGTVIRIRRKSILAAWNIQCEVPGLALIMLHVGILHLDHA